MRKSCRPASTCGIVFRSYSIKRTEPNRAQPSSLVIFTGQLGLEQFGFLAVHT